MYFLPGSFTVLTSFFPFFVQMVPNQSLLPKINEHLPPDIRVIGESFYTKQCLNFLGCSLVRKPVSRCLLDSSLWKRCCCPLPSPLATHFLKRKWLTKTFPLKWHEKTLECDWVISNSMSKDDVKRWMLNDSHYAHTTESGYTSLIWPSS